MYIISHHFANVNGFLKNKPPFFCIKKGRHCDALLTDLSSYLNATIDFVLSSLGFGLLLIGFVVFNTSIAIHNTSGFLIDFVHTELSRTPFSKRSFGNFRSRSAMPTCYPHDCERFSGFLLPSLLG